MGLTAFVIQGLIKLDDKDFKKSLSDAEGSAKSWGEKVSGVGSKIATGLKAAAVATGAAAAAVGKVAMSAVNAYSEYEQLTGGVETLFGTSAKNLKEYFDQVGIDGKSSAKEVSAAMDKYNSLVQAEEMVVQNAHKAFLTAGVDANTYMETVTSFSASLLQGLGGDTVKAAQIADMAMIDMSDNANKMGTDMSAIQNAYQGFAKQNFTMLDNLKLGYGGTRSEMQRLLKDAEKIMKSQGKNVKYSINNLSDIYEAIHVVQEEMGITGTTAEEARKTIQGSTKMMQAAWMNLKIAMVSPDGDIGQAITDMVESVKVAAKNWIPAIKQALSGIGEVVKEIAPIIGEELPGLLNDLLPGLIEGATSLISSLAEALPGLISTIVPILVETLPGLITQVIPALAEGAVTLVTALAQAFIDNIGVLADAVVQIIDNLANKFKESDSPLLQMFGNILDGIKIAFQWMIDNKETVVAAVGAIIAAFVASEIASFVAQLSPMTLLLTLIAALAAIIIANWGPISEFFTNLWNDISKAVSDAWTEFTKWVGDIETMVSSAWKTVSEWFKANVWTPLTRGFSELWDSVKQLWGNIESFVTKAWETISSWLYDNVWHPVEEKFTALWNVLTKFWTRILSHVVNAWNAVSQWLYDNVWKPVEDFFNEAWGVVKQFWTNIYNTVVNAWKEVSGWVEKNVTGPIKEAFEKVKSAVQAAIDKVNELLGLDGSSFTITEYHNTIGNNLPKATKDNPFPAVTQTIDPQGAGFFGGSIKKPKAKGDWSVPYDNYPALLHRNEMVLTASQARRYREGEGGDVNYSALSNAIVGAIRQGLEGAQVNSYLDGNEVTDAVNRILGDNLAARRFA